MRRPEQHALRAATAEDLAAIARIQKASPEASQWEPTSYLNYDCTVAVLADGEVAGFLVSRETAPGEHEVLNLAVSPAYRRCGIAWLLMDKELRRIPGEWFLEVRESNVHAIALYQALGFKPAHRRKGYYADSADGSQEDGIVMRFLS